MYVERYGDGPIRILGLHGWSGDHRTFAPLRPHLPADASLFAPDLPGYGRSPAPKQWRLNAVTAEIVDLVRNLARPRLAILGNCSGGLLGLCAVKELQRRGLAHFVDSIVLIDPLAFWPWYFSIFTSRSIGAYAYACSFQNPVGRWLVNKALAGRRREDTDLTEGLEQIPSHLALNSLRLLREIPNVDVFRDIRVPITILYGKKTFTSVRRSAERYRQVWPQAIVKEIPGSGHIPLREAPAAVARALEENLRCLRS